MRRGVAVVCFEVTIGESLYLSCLRLVISGILAGGIPGFRMVLCCFSHLRVWPCVCRCSPPFLVLLLRLRPYHYELTQCCHLLHESANELVASHFFVGWFLFGFCVVLVVWFCFVCFVVDDDGLLDYVQVLHQFSFVALNSRPPRVLI